MIYTVALATRLKRKVFLAGNIPVACEAMIRDIVAEEGVTIHSIRFYPYGVLMELESGADKTLDQIITAIRKGTSRKIRIMFPELHRMPSFWTEKYWSAEGGLSDDTVESAEKYFASLKAR